MINKELRDKYVEIIKTVKGVTIMEMEDRLDFIDDNTGLIISRVPLPFDSIYQDFERFVDVLKGRQKLVNGTLTPEILRVENIRYDLHLHIKLINKYNENTKFKVLLVGE